MLLLLTTTVACFYWIDLLGHLIGVVMVDLEDFLTDVTADAVKLNSYSLAFQIIRVWFRIRFLLRQGLLDITFLLNIRRVIFIFIAYQLY